MNVIYSVPLEKIRKTISNIELSDYLIKLLYSLLTTYSYVHDDIIIYTDFEGMSILSILPFKIKIMYGNSIHDFKKNIDKIQKDTYLLLDENHFFKSFVRFKDEYIIDSKINIHSLEKVEVSDIYIRLKNISEILFENYLQKINLLIKK